MRRFFDAAYYAATLLQLLLMRRYAAELPRYAHSVDASDVARRCLR